MSGYFGSRARHLFLSNGKDQKLISSWGNLRNVKLYRNLDHILGAFTKNCKLYSSDNHLSLLSPQLEFIMFLQDRNSYGFENEILNIAWP